MLADHHWSFSSEVGSRWKVWSIESHDLTYSLTASLVLLYQIYPLSPVSSPALDIKFFSLFQLISQKYPSLLLQLTFLCKIRFDRVSFTQWAVSRSLREELLVVLVLCGFLHGHTEAL